VPLAGRYIVDFCAPSVRLVVEVDGRDHELRRRADARRDAELRGLGYRVLRVEAALVMRDLAAVVALVRGAL
jgi:very-short-patch-repair endonuclease